MWPAGGCPGEKVASSAMSGAVLSTPRQLGPTRRMPASRQMCSSSAWRPSPSDPASPNPAESTTSARTPLRSHARAASTTSGAPRAITASSTWSGTSSIEAYAGRPASVVA
jgi:hypothetical protein